MDRKYKRPFHPCPPAARRRRQLLLARGDGGGLSALSVARSSGAQQGVARQYTAWTGGAGGVTVEPQGFLRARVSGRSVGEGRGRVSRLCHSALPDRQNEVSEGHAGTSAGVYNTDRAQSRGDPTPCPAATPADQEPSPCKSGGTHSPAQSGYCGMGAVLRLRRQCTGVSEPG
jgi:hypothetical protein